MLCDEESSRRAAEPGLRRLTSALPNRPRRFPRRDQIILSRCQCCLAGQRSARTKRWMRDPEAAITPGPSSRANDAPNIWCVAQKRRAARMRPSRFPTNFARTHAQRSTVTMDVPGSRENVLERFRPRPPAPCRDVMTARVECSEDARDETPSDVDRAEARRGANGAARATRRFFMFFAGLPIAIVFSRGIYVPPAAARQTRRSPKPPCPPLLRCCGIRPTVLCEK